MARTPGEILEIDFMIPLRLSQQQLAKHLGISPSAINRIVKGERVVTPRVAVMLANFFQTTPRFWLEAQMEYSLDQYLRTQEPPLT
mgnify:CR=1 FL=1